MAAIKFKNEALNSSYQLSVEVDYEINTPDGYKGMLSDVSDPKILDGMIARGNNMVSKIVPAQAPAGQAPGTGTQK